MARDRLLRHSHLFQGEFSRVGTLFVVIVGIYSHYTESVGATWRERSQICLEEAHWDRQKMLIWRSHQDSGRRPHGGADSQGCPHLLCASDSAFYHQ